MFVYSQTQVQKMLKVGKTTWHRRREEILDFISNYWEYELVQNKTGEVNFIVYEDEEVSLPKLPSKRSIDAKAKRRLYYLDAVRILKIDPCQTGRSLADRINESGFHTKDLADPYITGSSARFLAPFAKALKLYGITEEELKKLGIWVYKVDPTDDNQKSYEPLSQQQIQWLVDRLKKAEADSRGNVFDNLAYRDSEGQSLFKPSEAIENHKKDIETYKSIMFDFMNTYGVYPFKVAPVSNKEILDDEEIIFGIIDNVEEEIQQKREIKNSKTRESRSKAK